MNLLDELRVRRRITSEQLAKLSDSLASLEARFARVSVLSKLQQAELDGLRAVVDDLRFNASQIDGDLRWHRRYSRGTARDHRRPYQRASLQGRDGTTAPTRPGGVLRVFRAVYGDDVVPVVAE